ncbi:acyl-CoA N-acyltransferase [Triangularia verruculosa]|uniref:Acyl-CoA N-acyltransferase n=1 Tax=Triangularia verruculosa TaxID=2587418 RepID=A0AAN7AQF3_9PEZI|nr:acyl-CoA N-acyltransferase [Triangularia verruculosa]
MAPPAALTFRLATPEDAPLLQPLVQSAYRGETSRKGWTTEADLLVGTRIDVAGIVEKIQTPNSAVIMAFSPSQNNTLVACCEVLLKPSQKIGYFGMFAVDPTLQAGGIGRQVLANAEQYAKSHGADKMEMTVIWTRKELIDWYVRRGYTVTEERREFPHEELAKMDGENRALVEDLWFKVLIKAL